MCHRGRGTDSGEIVIRTLDSRDAAGATPLRGLQNLHYRRKGAMSSADEIIWYEQAAEG
jgi:hypothetical protein